MFTPPPEPTFLIFFQILFFNYVNPISSATFHPKDCRIPRSPQLHLPGSPRRPSESPGSSLPVHEAGARQHCCHHRSLHYPRWPKSERAKDAGNTAVFFRNSLLISNKDCWKTTVQNIFVEVMVVYQQIYHVILMFLVGSIPRQVTANEFQPGKNWD